MNTSKIQLITKTNHLKIISFVAQELTQKPLLCSLVLRNSTKLSPSAICAKVLRGFDSKLDEIILSQISYFSLFSTVSATLSTAI